MDVGCYCVNVARTLAAAEPVEAQAFAAWAETGVDAQMAGTLRFEDGLFAQLDCALTLERRESYVAAGPEGYLVDRLGVSPRHRRDGDCRAPRPRGSEPPRRRGSR